MKLPVSNTNAPVWRDITVKSELPSQLKALDELAKNLWWVWNSEAKNLFRELDPDLWRATGECCSSSSAAIALKKSLPTR